MLEFGVDFDDDLFGETKQKSIGISQESYSAKTCESQWFEDQTIDEPGDMHNIHKYRGDAAFYEGQYHRALACYDQSLDNVFSTNIPMYKDIQEARARCYIHIKDKVKATEIARQRVEDANNFDQHTSALHLMALVYETFHEYTDELHTIHCLLTLHSANPDLWLRLATIYNRLQDLERSDQSCNQCPPVHKVNDESGHVQDLGEKLDELQEELSNDQRIDGEGVFDTTAQDTLSNHKRSTFGVMEIAMYTCLIHARLLLRNVQNTISSFSKERNLQLEIKITEALNESNMSKEMQHTCAQFLYHNKEEEDAPHVDSDIHKLDMMARCTRASFESNWFSWYTMDCGDTGSLT